MWYTCVVNQVGPAIDATETAPDGTPTSPPVIYIKLTDTSTDPPPAFTEQYFFAADGEKNQMLAVALAAINGNKTVWAASADPPITGIPEIQRLYLNAS
jgi:hypothetical protein